MSLQEATQQINDAKSFMDIAKVFNTLFGVPLPGQEPPEKPDSYKNENSDFGLKEKGIKTRERLNAAAKEILDRVKDPKDLTRADIDILKQYSGKGGLQTEGSQYEYYTPQHVAEGCWYTLKANGFTGGNVLDPSTGAGMFEATKNPAAIITGCDLDATSSRIAQLLHPEEKIETKPFEQLAIETPDNTFDAVITNVPFGSARGKYKHIDAPYKNEKQIERYFILRALHKVRPGGLAVFVCPINIVGAKGDAQFAKWRTEVSKLAEFMGAHKLPSKTFKGQGTDTVVDVVVFRKHPESLLEKLDSIPFDTLKAANVVWDEFIQGRYWQGEGKKYIMGTYVPKVEGDRWSREVVDGDVDDAGLKAKLAAKFDSRIDWAMLEAAEPVERVYAEGDRKIMNGAEYEFTHGQWVKVVSTANSTPIDKEKFGAESLEELRGILQDPRACMNLTAKQAFAVWKTYPDLMPALPKQAIEFTMRQPKVEYQEQLWRGSLIGGMIGRYQAQVTEGESNENERVALQELVAAEVMKYGHPANCKGLAVIGEDSRMYGVFKNSLDVKGNYSDLLNGTLEGSGNNLQFDPSNLQSIVEHLYVREGYTSIQLEDAQAMYTGGKNITSLADLAECEEIAITPDGIIMPVSRYCAGDVYPKIDAMTMAMATETDPRMIACYQRQIDNISRKVKITPLHEIDFTLQQKWIPKEMMRDYLKDAGYEVRYGAYQDVQEQDALSGEMRTKSVFVEDYNNPFGEWQIAGLSGRGYNQKVDFEKKLSGFTLNLEKHLNGKSILDRVEKDDEGTRNSYLQQLEALNTGLTGYISGHPDIETVLASYNRKMNGYIPLDYDESDLGLKGVAGQIKLHTYQNAAIRRLSEEGCGILAHNVGLGKSFQALGLAKYNVQMGRSKKVCIVVPNSVLSNWYHEAKMLYGDLSHALFVGIRPELDEAGGVKQVNILDEWGQPKAGKDGKPLMQDLLKSSNNAEEVYNTMWQIPGSNASLVIMTQERYGQIPLKQESKDAYVEVMKEDMKNAKAKIDEAKKGKKKGGYGTAVEDERNEGKLSDEGTKKRGDFPFFEDMGFTDVIVDEAHCFPYNTEVVTIDGIIKIGDLCEQRIETKILSMDTKTGIMSYQPIKAWMPKPLLKQLVKVEHESGSFICTRDHLVWTQEAGYVEAGKLSGEHTLQVLQDRATSKETPDNVLQQDLCEKVDNGSGFGRENLLELRGEIQREHSQGPRTEEEVLQHEMLGSMADEPARIKGEDASSIDGAYMEQGSKKTGIISKDEDKQSDVQRGISGEDDNCPDGTGVQEAGGQRQGLDSPAINADEGHERENRVCSENEINTTSDCETAKLLQGGYCVSGPDDSGGGGRLEPQNQESARARSEEGSRLAVSRVASVEVLEPSDFERYGLGDPRDFSVYDIEVEENHNFFANGVLVHNCFKNAVAASGNYDRMYYLPNTAPSQRALDMAMKMHNLKMNNNGRGAYFLTATPITNSLNEVYAMLNHVIPREEFINRGIYTLDDFLATFGEFKSVDKLKADGNIYTAEGLTGFQNLDGLRDLFFKYTNMKNATQVEELRNSMPEAVKVTAEVELSGEQSEIYEALREEAEAKKGGGLGLLRKLDKATTDLDLYFNRMTWHFPLRLKDNVQAMLKSLPESVIGRDRPEPGDANFDDEIAKNGGEQPIAEVTIYLKDMLKTEVQGDTFIVVTHAGYEDAVLGALPQHKISEDDISHPISAKYAALIENCKKEMEANGKQIIFSEEKAQHKKIVRILVHQIPALRNKVGIINATEAKGNELQKISDAYNTGMLVYIIANRKAEVGVNLQKGTTAIHHMTYPWTKASLTQREGRGVRQGNTAKKVTVYYYQAAGTVDMMRLDLIEHKGALIDDIAEGSGNRAANGDADPAILGVMFAKDPEEARRKMKEQLEAKAKAEAERLRTSLINQFTAYASNVQQLATIEDKREAERTKLTEQIAKHNENIQKNKDKGATYAPGDPNRKYMAERVQSETAERDKKQAKLDNLDVIFDTQKTKAEGNVKRAASTLKAAAANGTLPIDPALLDHPEDTLMTADGLSFLSKGDMYEVRRYDGATTCIIKVTGVAQSLTRDDGTVVPYKGFSFEQLTGLPTSTYGSSNLPQRCNKDSNGMIPLSQFLDKSKSEPVPVRCTYSEKEIMLQKKLAEKHSDYSKLPEVMDKDFFTEYYDKISFSGMVGLVGRDASGVIGLHDHLEDGVKIVWPDTKDENLRKAVAEFALQKKRGEGLSYWDKNTLKGFFGYNWEAQIAEYGSKATQADVVKYMQEQWQNELKGRNQTLRDYVQQIQEYSSTQENTLRAFVTNSGTLGDNSDEIKQWAIEARSAIEAEISKARDEIRAEEEKAKLEAVKNHPDYKEIQENIKQAFDRLGITVKVNTGDIVLPGFKGRGGERVPAFSRWFMQDSNGKSGALYRMKDQIKGQFAAKYFADAGGEFNGSWWHVDAKTELSRIYELLA